MGLSLPMLVGSVTAERQTARLTPEPHSPEEQAQSWAGELTSDPSWPRGVACCYLSPSYPSDRFCCQVSLPHCAI